MSPKEDVGDTGLDVNELPVTTAEYAIIGSSEFHVNILGDTVLNGTGMTIIQGRVELPCVPVFVEVEFADSMRFPTPVISVVIDVRAKNGSRVYASGSNLHIAVTRLPPEGYADPRSDVDLSVFNQVAHLPYLKDQDDFELLQEVFGAEPVGYETLVLHEKNKAASEVMYEGNLTNKLVELGIINYQSSQIRGGENSDGAETGNISMVAPHGKYVFVIYPPCPRLYRFDQYGRPSELSLNKVNYPDIGPSSSIESMSETGVSSDSIGIAYSEGGLDEALIQAQGMKLDEVPVAQFSYAITAAHEFNITILGQLVERGSLHNILVGTAESPCVPVFIETQYWMSENAVHQSALSVALSIGGTNSDLTFYSGHRDLPILVAVNPLPGYDDPWSDYDYVKFQPAVPVPLISDDSSFGKMLTLTGALPTGPLQQSPLSAPENETTGTETLTQNQGQSMMQAVYIIRIPSCERLCRFGTDGHPEHDETVDELFDAMTGFTYGVDNDDDNDDYDDDDGVVLPTSESSDNNFRKSSSQSMSVESIENVHGDMVGFENGTFQKYISGMNILSINASNVQLDRVPTISFKYSVLGSDDLSVRVLGKGVQSGPARTVLRGTTDAPCVPFFVEMDFKNDTSFPSPTISIVLETDMGNTSNIYVSGSTLRIFVTNSALRDYVEPASDYDNEGFVETINLQEPVRNNEFGLLQETFGAKPVTHSELGQILADLAEQPSTG